MACAWHGVILLSVTVVVLSSDDIKIKCGKDSVEVTWPLSEALAQEPSRLFLGNCHASSYSRLDAGGGVATFHYRLTDCLFKRRFTGSKMIFENQLTHRPQAKIKSPALSFPIKCVYERPDGLESPYLKPVGDIKGHGGLVFVMGLLNKDLNGPALSNSFPFGSFIPIWFAVEQEAHQPLILLLEECLASTSPHLGPESQTYPVITNKGCLVDSVTGHSKFHPRTDSSSILLLLQTFRFAVGEDVFIHCKLLAWDPKDLNESKKACHYNKELGGWEHLDDPFQNGLCRCCDSTCRKRKRRELEFEPQGLVQNAVLGPLIITEALDQVDHDAS
ncbi:zona pellucida glycoprotein 3f, tandem duplicate 2 [Chanos chanos]|uniref:Zona pellucida glycoprotein 3f, tandem duplicate 2 n=1 Tax=Chanos chanos TaxID=29144 RepID=A0A6J2VCC7_CHACN|nr:uncharacterized protein LOC115812147 [Chanos chanos]